MTKKVEKPKKENQYIKKQGGPGRIPNKDKVGDTYKVLAERNPELAIKNTESLAIMAQGFFKNNKPKKKNQSKKHKLSLEEQYF